MNAKIKSILLVAVLTACGTSKDSESCSLDAKYTFNFEQAQYYAMPVIDFSFQLSYDWQVRMPEFGKQNFNYYEAARYTDDSTSSILLKIHSFKRLGSFVSVQEQSQAQQFINLQNARRDSWKTLKRDTIDQWWVNYGYYEQEPFPFIIAHKLILRDTLSNGLFLELQMPCPLDSFNLRREKCLESVIQSFKIHL